MIAPDPRCWVLVSAALLAAVGAFAQAPPAAPDPMAVAERFRQLDDTDAAARKAAVEALIVTKDAQVLARLRRTLQESATAWIRKATAERGRALRALMAASRKGFDPQAFALRQKEVLALLAAGDTKKMEAPVKAMWKDFYFDPAQADADPKAAEAVARVREIEGCLKSAGADEKEKDREPPGARLQEAFRALDESHVIQLMPPRDQKAMLQNAALRPQIPEEEYQLVFMTNQYRVLVGKSALRLDPKLCAAARDHSKDMVEKKFFAHESPVPGKRTFADRATKAGTSAHAENIAMGSERAEGPFWMWFFSLGHHQNVLGDHSSLGVGNHEKHWTEMFG